MEESLKLLLFVKKQAEQDLKNLLLEKKHKRIKSDSTTVQIRFNAVRISFPIC